MHQVAQRKPVDDVLSPISRQRGSLRQRADEQG